MLQAVAGACGADLAKHHAKHGIHGLRGSMLVAAPRMGGHAQTSGSEANGERIDLAVLRGVEQAVPLPLYEQVEPTQCA